MARTTASSRTTKSTATQKPAPSRSRTKSDKAPAAKKQPRTKATGKKGSAASKPSVTVTKAAKTATAGAAPAPAPGRDVLVHVEQLSVQIGAAVETLAELAAAHARRSDDTVRTLPADRAAATFRRLVGESVDDHVGQMLPPLIALRNELAQRADAGDASGDGLAERGRQTLDHVLALAEVTTYDARVGEPYDPLIHLGVEEVAVAGLSPGMVAEALQAGYRTAGGKVLVPARVKVSGG